jgi:hypothetical protein
MSTEIADPQIAKRYAGGEVLAGITVTARYRVTADPEGGDLTSATLAVYTVDATTGVATAVDEVDTPTHTATELIALARVTFPDGMTRRTMVVTFDLDQDDVDLDAAEIAFDVIGRAGQPPGPS